MVEVGQPNIWSLGQAHYLLANMRERSRDLGVKVPAPSDLAPSAANATRMSLLRTMVGAEVNYDQVGGVQNALSSQRFDADLTRFTATQNKLDALTAPFTDAVREVSSLTVQLAALPSDKPEFADQRKQLTTQLAAKTAEKDALKAEMDILRQQVTAPSVPSTFKGSLPTTTPSALPDDLTKVLDKLNATVSTPQLNASTTLENYVQMQYEVIAKQLTLLRDEVGPEQRLVFLEMPMSLYSVPKVDDDYVVRLEWKVDRFFGPLTSRATMAAVENEETSHDDNGEEQSQPITLDMLREAEPGRLESQGADSPLAGELSREGWRTADPTKFRVIDIIPRQSALNVNDQHGTQKGFALTAKFLTMFGMGGQVSFQRQRSLYEQFIQQEVYASAYGKGMSNFGWTFGPLPGTTRLAPGVRTTYAILAIPRDALALELKVAAKVYKRNVSPADATVKPVIQSDEGYGAGTYRILVPNERTEGFWVDHVVYTPVAKGNQATMMIEGRYFSPLTGVLVNGVPLKRAVSIAKNESSTANLLSVPAIDPAGEYEYLNPQQLILSFKMDPTYVGTPLITLVTPEKTSAINFFKLDDINFHYKKTSLANVSEVEPMFGDVFGLSGIEVVDDSQTDFVTVDVYGTGLRRGAKFFIGPVALDTRKGEQATQLSPGLYRLKFLRPAEGRALKIKYRNSTRQAVQEGYVTFQQTVVSDYQIVRYEPAAGRGQAMLDLILTVTGQDAAPSIQIDTSDGSVMQGPSALGNHRFRLRILAKRDPVPLTVTGVNGVTRIFDVGLPAPPTINSVVNTTTGKPQGSGAKSAIVTLRGINFGHVVRVLFGSKEATILQADEEVILVNAPTGDEGAVQILLETNVNLRGKLVSNIADFRTAGKAIYTYTQ
jgi:hypothetical protein